MLPGQKAAGGKNVLPPGSTDGGRESALGQAVPESLHLLLRGRSIGKVRNPVETDQVHTAFQGAEKLHQRIGMPLRVVPAMENGILETDTALAAEVVLFQEPDNLCLRPSLLDRHHLGTLFRERIVQAYRQVALALVQELFQLRKDADGAEGDAFGTPGQPPGSREHFHHTLHLLPVIQGFAHAHKNGIGELPGFCNGKKLAQDIGSIQIPVKTLPACHAELAAHLAAGL